jgi:hypothetical protein
VETIWGWLNEFAFVSVDANPWAMCAMWPSDIGCGVKYFSQCAVVKLPLRVGIPIDGAPSPAAKLKPVQEKTERISAEAMK